MKHFIKSPKTYIFIIIMTPLIILGAFFFNYYKLYSNLVDPPANHSNSIDGKTNIVVKNPFDTIDIVEDDSKEILASLEENKDLNINNKTAKQDIVAKDKLQLEDSRNKSTNNNEINSLNTKDKISYEYIVGTYKGKFENLQRKQENDLSSLMEEAKAEYIKKGSKKTNALSLASKYLSLVSNMEKQSDNEFNALIGNLKTDLKSNSYNTDIIKEISDYYNYYKKSLKAQLFNKASKHL